MNTTIDFEKAAEGESFGALAVGTKKYRNEYITLNELYLSDRQTRLLVATTNFFSGLMNRLSNRKNRTVKIRIEKALYKS